MATTKDPTTESTQTDAMKAAFGDNTVAPFDRLKQSYDARQQEAASAAAQQAQSAATTSAFNESMTNKNRWSSLLDKLRGRKANRTPSIQELMAQIPNLGK